MTSSIERGRSAIQRSSACAGIQHDDLLHWSTDVVWRLWYSGRRCHLVDPPCGMSMVIFSAERYFGGTKSVRRADVYGSTSDIYYTDPTQALAFQRTIMADTLQAWSITNDSIRGCAASKLLIHFAQLCLSIHGPWDLNPLFFLKWISYCLTILSTAQYFLKKWNGWYRNEALLRLRSGNVRVYCVACADPRREIGDYDLATIYP